MIRAVCPVCWHEDSLEDIQKDREIIHYDCSLMDWSPGCWTCPSCEVVLPPRIAAILLDAVLRVSDPDSDSYDEGSKTFGDALDAAAGGRRTGWRM
jgi:hypothetical protein